MLISHLYNNLRCHTIAFKMLYCSVNCLYYGQLSLLIALKMNYGKSKLQLNDFHRVVLMISGNVAIIIIIANYYKQN